MAIGGTTAAVVFAVAALASAALTAYAQYSQAQYQAGVLQYNAALQRYQADYATQLAGFEAKMMERQAHGVMALAEAQAALSEQQAEVARNQAAYAQAAGDVREAAIRRAYARAQSEVRAAIGKSGVDTTGSPLLVLMENADTVGKELALNDYQTALDVYAARLDEHGATAGAAFARAEGSMRAAGLSAEAQYRRFGGELTAFGARSQANLFSSQADAVRRAGFINVGSTLLTGGANAVSPFLRYGRAA